MCVLREYVCFTAVMNPCGKKKPESQKVVGAPSLTQPSIIARRRKKSLVQLING